MVIGRFCQTMKEQILKLHELKYHPETTKLEEMLSIDRVEVREQHARKELQAIVSAREKILRK